MKYDTYAENPIILEFKDVEFSYLNQKVIDCLSWSIRSGEFQTIIGRSGTGKSTFLDLASGLTPSQAGVIEYHGQKVVGPISEIGFVFQQPTLLDWMSVSENILLPIKIKRHLRHLLDDDIYNWIKGETDSEHLFALFLQLAKGKDLTHLSNVADVLEATFTQIIQLINNYGTPGPSYFNVCLTDGRRLLASRSCTDERITPETMHYSMGRQYVAQKGRYHMLASKGIPKSLLVASEKLTDFDVEWHDVPPNHLLLVEADLNIQLRPL